MGHTATKLTSRINAAGTNLLWSLPGWGGSACRRSVASLPTAQATTIAPLRWWALGLAETRGPQQVADLSGVRATSWAVVIGGQRRSLVQWCWRTLFRGYFCRRGPCSCDCRHLGPAALPARVAGQHHHERVVRHVNVSCTACENDVNDVECPLPERWEPPSAQRVRQEGRFIPTTDPRRG